jgi:hypothetical protein
MERTSSILTNYNAPVQNIFNYHTDEQVEYVEEEESYESEELYQPQSYQVVSADTWPEKLLKFSFALLTFGAACSILSLVAFIAVIVVKLAMS